MREPHWVPRLAVDAVHIDQLREHGGLPGIRDENALESALQRPRQKWAYEESVDLAVLAAAYGFGICSNHPYRDGNKRIAFLAMVIFLGLNGSEIEAAEPEVVTVMKALASGKFSEQELAGWLRGNLMPLAPE
jgi:death on curing protein